LLWWNKFTHAAASCPMHLKDILITALGMETFGKLCRRAQYYKQITHGALSQASEHPRKCKYMKSEFMALEQIYNCD
jgi:hypothetical protein